jgi:hypothetical protein
MTPPQSGGLDGGEQPQGLPEACAQRLCEVPVFIPAWDSALRLVAARTAPVLCFPSHRRDRRPSRPAGRTVAMALAILQLPSHGHRRVPLEGADDFSHRIGSRAA